jgi:hypothetical protein
MPRLSRAAVLFMLLVAAVASACSSNDTTNTPPPASGGAGTAVLADATRVLDGDTRAALSSYAPDGTLTFSHSTPLLDGLAPGAILDSATNPPVAPAGFLRKVTAVNRSGGQVVVQTTQAHLEEALKSANISFRKPITKMDIASFTPGGPGVSMPMHRPGKIESPAPGLTVPISNFQIQLGSDNVMVTITINGTVTLNPTINLNLATAFDATKGGEYVSDFLCYGELDVDSDLTLEGDLTVTGTLEKEATLFTTVLTPIDVQAGPFALVFVPTLTVKLYVSATGQVSITVHETESLALAAGGEFQHDRSPQWQDLSHVDGMGTIDPPSFAASVELEAGAKVKLGVKLYDASPGVYADAFAAAKITAETPHHPFLTAGLHAGVEAGLDIGIGDYVTLASWSFPVVAWDLPLWSSPNIPPALVVTSPGEGAHVPLGEPVSFQSASYDLEDGTDDEQHLHVTWTSDVEGVLGHGSSFTHSLDPQHPGARTITATATDSDGATTTAVRHLVVDPVPPTTLIDSPTSGSSVYAATPVRLVASQASGTYPSTDICTVSGFKFVWSSSVASDSIANTSACGSTTATFTDTTQPHILTYEVDDPWGEKVFASVQFNVIPLPPNTFASVDFGTPGVNQVFVAPAAISESITTTPAATAPATYTWTARSYASDGVTVYATTTIAMNGATPSVSWNPASVQGFIDPASSQSVTGEKIELDVHVVDATGMSGDGKQFVWWTVTPP